MDRIVAGEKTLITLDKRLVKNSFLGSLLAFFCCLNRINTLKKMTYADVLELVYRQRKNKS